MWGVFLDIGLVIEKVGSVLKDDDRVSFCLLFGSLVRGVWGENSDIDIAIYPKGKLSVDDRLDILYEIAKCLNVNEDKLDLVVLDDLTPLELRYRIFRNGVPVVIKDVVAYRRYRDKSISMYLDFKVFIDKLRLVERYLDKIRVE